MYSARRKEARATGKIFSLGGFQKCSSKDVMCFGIMVLHG